MRERELLQRIADRSADLPGSFDRVLVGPGDDCAVLAPDERRLVLTTDHLVQNRHFDHTLPLELIARKAVMRSVSDISAMAAEPAWALATALLPVGYAHADELFDHMAHHAREFGCPLVGGDIASLPPKNDGPISLTVTIGGYAEEPVLRSGARAGDAVYTTGELGGSMTNNRHAKATPRVVVALELARLTTIHAMIDLSDGLGIDAARIARASGVRLELDADTIPIHTDASGLSGALGDGEDYELLFTAPSRATIPESIGVARITRIGRVVEGEPATIVRMPDGSTIDASEQGFEHG
ncbi:MAG: thiamine-phosphate kinase [Phycisphaerales bacterium]|nr:thiamine-phosphate kinase [Phycisphaerales bacterium]